MSTDTGSRQSLWQHRITVALTRFMRLFSAHWLLIANLALALYIGLPFLAPVLMRADHTLGAKIIYSVFRPLCHQMPERSYFLFGERLTWSLEALNSHLGSLAPRRFVGNAVTGYKVAVCQRCVAIYGTMLLCGLLFGLVRTRVEPLSIKGFIALLVPMGIDGMGQLLHLWSSTPFTRTLTGALFGLACIWLAFPYLQTGMAEINRETSKTIKEWQ